MPKGLAQKTILEPLENIVEFLDHKRKPITAEDRKPGPYPYYGANGKQDSVDGYLFDEPLILLAEDGGHFLQPERGIAYKIQGKSWVNNHAHVLRPKKTVDVNYLTRVLENYDVRQFVSGTTRLKLTKGKAARIPIPLPPLEEQRRIAEILDLADGLRVKRREALAEVEGLTEAVFLEMFGDPNNYQVFPLGENLRFLTSGSRGWARYYSDRGSPFIRIQNVRHGYMETEDLAYVTPPESAEAKRTRVEENDVLLSITADLGRAAKVLPSLIGGHINQHLAILRLSEALRPDYLVGYLSSQPAIDQFTKLNRGGVKAGLNFDNVRSLIVPLPPLPLQQKFAERVEAIEKLKASHQRSLEEMDALFASLQSRAFKGEL